MKNNPFESRRGEFPEEYELKKDKVYDALTVYLSNFDVQEKPKK